MGDWMCSGVRETAQRHAGSDTYRLQCAASVDRAPQTQGLRCHGVPGGAQACPSPGGASWQQDTGCGVMGTPSPPCPLSHSLSRTSMRICSLTAPGCCQPLAPRPGGRGTASRSVSLRGVSSPVAFLGLPLPLAYHCARQQVRRVSLHPARRPNETFTSPIIACTRLQAASISPTVDTGPTDTNTDTNTDQSVSTGRWGICWGAERLGEPHHPWPSGRWEGWSASTSCPPTLSPIGGQWLLLTILAGLTGQCHHLPLSQHRPLQRLCQQPQPEVTAEHFG